MYSILDPSLFVVADLAKSRLSDRYGLNNCQVEKPFDSSINFVSTFHWKTSTHYIVCEVSNRPFPKTIKAIFADILVKGLSVKLIVVYPANCTLSTKEFQEDIKDAKSFGIGLVSVDEVYNSAVIDYEGLSIQLHQPKVDLNKFVKKLRPSVEGALTTYYNGDTKHAVQELGQIVENIIRNVAIDAKKKGTSKKGGDPKSDKYPFAKVVDDLVNEVIIDQAILGKCRGFVEDRNRVSHKPKTSKKAIELDRKLKLDFQTGLRILEDLPQKISAKNYKLKV